MRLSKVLSGASLAVALVAFGLAGALSLRSHVEPFYAVLRSVGAFGGCPLSGSLERLGARIS